MHLTIKERKESMATGKALDGKPYAGNPHVRFDEGEVAPAAKPRRGSLLYRTLCGTILAAAVFAVTCANSATVADENADQVNEEAAVFEGKIPAKMRGGELVFEMTSKRNACATLHE